MCFLNLVTDSNRHLDFDKSQNVGLNCSAKTQCSFKICQTLNHSTTFLTGFSPNDLSNQPQPATTNPKFEGIFGAFAFGHRDVCRGRSPLWRAWDLIRGNTTEQHK
ncbi:hypothetical protein F8388_004006, partial [Cannabis sativa]